MNHGLNLELEKLHQKPEDWVLGSSGMVCIAEIPPKERRDYLPDGEVQKGKEDTMDCASRAPVNILEAKFTYLYRNNLIPDTHKTFLLDKGYVKDGKVSFSDRFVAINSNTTKQGNSLIAPIEAIRKHGLIPKKLLPLEPWMTFEDYHDPGKIKLSMISLGGTFLDYFQINYERVSEKDFEYLLKDDLLDVGGYAWPEPVGEEYPRTNGTPNHAFVVWNPKYYAFDNYPDSFDGDFIKKLAPNYDLIDIGYSIIISLKQKKSILEKVKDYFRELFR